MITWEEQTNHRLVAILGHTIETSFAINRRSKVMTLDKFTSQYIETALWSSTHQDTEEPLDDWATIHNLSPETLVQMVEDCKNFQLENLDDIDLEESRAGRDFWLTRNGHGAGFWDGDWPEPAASRLTENSKLYGECCLIVGDDDLIYTL